MPGRLGGIPLGDGLLQGCLGGQDLGWVMAGLHRLQQRLGCRHRRLGLCLLRLEGGGIQLHKNLAGFNLIPLFDR